MAHYVIQTLAQGSLYALLAVGLTCMYGAQAALVLTYGGLYMVGGYVTWWTLWANRPLWLALGLAVVLCMGLSVILQGCVRTCCTERAEHMTLLGGVGFLVCLAEVGRLAIGPHHLKVVAFDSHRLYHLGPLMLTTMHWVIFGSTFGLLILVQGVLTTSRGGRAVQALLARQAAGEHVPWSRWHLLAAGLGAMLAGVSGVLSGVSQGVQPMMGIRMTYTLGAVVLIGTLGSVRGAIAAAFGLALLEGVVLPATRLPIPSEAVFLVVLALASVTWARCRVARQPPAQR
jgi:branched-subunit amino acid ABC-type transport system permease component